MVVDPRATAPPRVANGKDGGGGGNPFEFFCGRPRDAARKCGHFNERGLQSMVRRGGEGLARATRSLGRAVGDAASAAALAVDDLDRHTVERVVTTVKTKFDGAPTFQKEAPLVYARVRARPNPR